MSRLDVVVDRLASGAAHVRLAGDFAHEFAYTFDAELQKVEAAAGTVVIDLRGLRFMDSAGLGRLLAARRRAARAGRRLVIVRGGRVVDRIMLLVGLQDVLEMVPEVPAELLAPSGGRAKLQR